MLKAEKRFHARCLARAARVCLGKTSSEPGSQTKPGNECAGLAFGREAFSRSARQQLVGRLQDCIITSPWQCKAGPEQGGTAFMRRLPWRTREHLLVVVGRCVTSFGCSGESPPGSGALVVKRLWIDCRRAP